MRNYRQVVDEVFERSDKYFKAKQKRKRILLATILPSVACFIIIPAVTIALLINSNFASGGSPFPNDDLAPDYQAKYSSMVIEVTNETQALKTQELNVEQIKTVEQFISTIEEDGTNRNPNYNEDNGIEEFPDPEENVDYLIFVKDKAGYELNILVTRYYLRTCEGEVIFIDLQQYRAFQNIIVDVINQI